jgi:hypothetical protein
MDLLKVTEHTYVTTKTWIQEFKTRRENHGEGVPTLPHYSIGLSFND